MLLTKVCSQVPKGKVFVHVEQAVNEFLKKNKKTRKTAPPLTNLDFLKLRSVNHRLKGPLINNHLSMNEIL